MKLEDTEWAREFKRDCPTSYLQAIEYAGTPKMLWAIAPVSDPEFWMDAKPTKKEAVALCRKMKWR